MGLALRPPGSSRQPYTQPRAGCKPARPRREAQTGGLRPPGDDGDGGAEPNALGHAAELEGGDRTAIQQDRSISGIRTSTLDAVVHLDGSHRSVQRNAEELGARAQPLRGVAQGAPPLSSEVGQLPAGQRALDNGAIDVTKGFDQRQRPGNAGLLVDVVEVGVFGRGRDLRRELVEEVSRGDTPPTLLVEVGQRILGQAIANGTQNALSCIGREFNAPGGVEALEGG